MSPSVSFCAVRGARQQHPHGLNVSRRAGFPVQLRGQAWARLRLSRCWMSAVEGGGRGAGLRVGGQRVAALRLDRPPCVTARLWCADGGMRKCDGMGRSGHGTGDTAVVGVVIACVVSCGGPKPARSALLHGHFVGVRQGNQHSVRGDDHDQEQLKNDAVGDGSPHVDILRLERIKVKGRTWQRTRPPWGPVPGIRGPQLDAAARRARCATVTVTDTRSRRTVHGPRRSRLCVVHHVPSVLTTQNHPPGLRTQSLFR
jgi:hypothetical protein